MHYFTTFEVCDASRAGQCFISLCLFAISVGDAEIQGQKMVPVLNFQRVCLWLY